MINLFISQIDANNLKAVIFIIHGGYYNIGGNFWYGPDFVMEEDIVFVTMNYRLGALGIFSRNYIF